MKQIYSFFLIILSVLSFVSCNNKSTELVSVIPANAKSIIRVDAQSLIQKSEYDIFKNPKISQLISFFGKGMNETQTNLLNNFMKDANSLGINIKSDLYIYTDSTNLGIVLQVLDPKILESSFINSGLLKKEDIQQENDLHIVSLLYPNLVMAWDDNRLLIIKDLTRREFVITKEEAVGYLKNHLAQPEDKSIAINTQFKEFLSKKQDISIYSNLIDITNLSDIGIKYPNEFQDIKLAFYINFEKGEIASSSKFLYPSAAIEKRFIEKGHTLLGSLKGEQLNYIPQNTILTLSANIKGRELINLLNSFHFFDNMRSDNMLIKTFIANIDGDVTLSVLPSTNQDLNSDKFEDTDPHIIILADIANSQNILDTFISFIQNKNGVKVIRMDSESYKISSPYMPDIYLRAKGNLLSITNLEDADLKIKNGVETSNDYNNYAKDKSVVLFGQSDNLYKQILDARFEFYPSAYQFTNSFSSLLDDYKFSLKADDFSGHGSIALKDKDKNSLNAFCVRFDSVLQDLISSFL